MAATIKPPIVIDAANVASWYGKNINFCCRGILLCLAYFKARKHQCFVFLPQKWETFSDIDNVVDGEILVQLKGYISYLPDGSHDDGFIIQTAHDKNAVILSNDQYRQEINARPDWFEVVNNRLLTYTFVEDTFCPNPNPAGMSLEVFLTGSHLGFSRIRDTRNSSRDSSSNDELLKSVLNNENDKRKVNNNNNKQRNNNNNDTTTYHRNALLTGLSNKTADDSYSKRPQQKRNDGKNKKNNNFNQSIEGGTVGGETRKSSNKQEQKICGNNKRVPTAKIEQQRFSTPKFDARSSEDFDPDDLQSCSSTHSFGSEGLSSPSLKKLTYGIGSVTKINQYDGYIEAPGLKSEVRFSLTTYNKMVSSFNMDICKDLTEIFRINDEIAFSSGCINSEGVMEAAMVSRLIDTIHGYGKLVEDIRESTAIIRPEKIDSRSLVIDSSIFCPGSAFKDGTKLKSMKLEDWVEFFAVKQTTFDSIAKYKYIAVKANVLTVEGVFVKIADAYGILWSRRAGFVFCSKPKAGIAEHYYKIGQWISCQVRGQSEKNGCKWHVIRGRDIQAVVKTRISNNEDIEVEVDGFAGFITNTYGSIWCDNLGRIMIVDSALKKCKSFKPMQRVHVRAKYNSQCHASQVDYVWEAVDVKPLPFVDRQQQQNSSSSSSSSCWPMDSSLFTNVQLTVEGVQCKNNKPCYAFLKSDKYGDVFARYLDCCPSFGEWKKGDSVFGSIVAQELPNVMWRAFCLDEKPIQQYSN